MPKGIMLTPEQQEERREEIISVALQLIEKMDSKNINEGNCDFSKHGKVQSV